MKASKRPGENILVCTTMNFHVAKRFSFDRCYTYHGYSSFSIVFGHMLPNPEEVQHHLFSR